MESAWNIDLSHTVLLITHDYLCFVNVERSTGEYVYETLALQLHLKSIMIVVAAIL